MPESEGVRQAEGGGRGGGPRPVLSAEPAGGAPCAVSDEFKRFANRSHDVVYRYDVIHKKYLFWNEVGLLTYGAFDDGRHPTRHTVLQLVLPEDRERVRRVARASRAAGGTKGEVEYRIRYRDGSVRWMHDKWIVIRDAAGRAVTIEGVVRDDTERKEAQEALRESRESYRHLVERMNDGLVTADREDNLTYVNQRFCVMLGYEASELLGRPVARFIEPDDLAVLEEQASLRSNGERNPYEIRWVGRNNRNVLPTIVSPEPVFDEEGNFEGSFAVVTDISEQKRIQHALKERERELEAKKNSLEDMIGALNVLLKRREEDKVEMQRSLARSAKECIEPYLEKLKSTDLRAEQGVLLSILEAGFRELVTSVAGHEPEDSHRFTATESQVAKLVRIGKSTKEIAGVLNLSPRTVESHRYNIRKKLGIRHSGQPLRSGLAATRKPSTLQGGGRLQDLGAV